MPSLRESFTIVNEKGLHARAANAFVRVAKEYESSIKVYRSGTPANGKQIMGLLILAAPKGSEIELEIEGADAEEAMAALGRLIRSGFGEED